MRFFSIICATLMVLLLLAVPLIHGTMSHAQMLATSGGANCKVCPGEANSSCEKTTCSFFPKTETLPARCREYSGGDYKVCAQGDHPEQECDNDDKVSCGQLKFCDDGDGQCNADTYDCTCHSQTVKRSGCA